MIERAWNFIGSCVDGEPFSIEGLNVWDFQWVRRGDEVATVRDPSHNEEFLFEVYEVIHGAQKVTFAAGEFSNSIWGFYQER